TIMAYETGLRLKTIQHQLKQLADRGEIYKQRRGMGEEFLYRDAGKGRVKQIDHILSTADAWATVRKAASLLHIGLEDELPKEFTSSKGTTEPDLVFSLRAQDEKNFYTWEEDLGSERGKEVFLKKLSLMWWWRHEHCHDRVHANVWGIKT